MQRRRLSPVLLFIVALALVGPIASTNADAAPEAAAPSSYGGWIEVGHDSAAPFAGVSPDGSGSGWGTLAFLPGDVPIVVWNQAGYNDVPMIWVRTFDGTSWVEMGEGSAADSGLSVTPNGSKRPSLTVSPDGIPYVSWIEDLHPKVYVKRFDGTAWVEAGEGAASGSGASVIGDPYELASAMSADGTLYLAWQQGFEGKEIWVRRFDGEHWVEVGAGSASGGGISNTPTFSQWPTMAIGPDGQPWVAWVEAGGELFVVYVRRFDGTAWVEVGPGSASGTGVIPNGISKMVQLAFDPSGTAWMVCQNILSNHRGAVYVLRWNGDAWVEASAGSASGDGISPSASNAVDPSIYFSPDGTPYIAWMDLATTFLHVQTWDGQAWRELSAPRETHTGYIVRDLNRTSLAMDSHGTLYACFSSFPMGVYVIRWTGTEWVEAFGAGPQVGISSSRQESTSPRLAAGLGGRVYASYVDCTTAGCRVYARVWDGRMWQSLGDGPASGASEADALPADGGSSWPGLAVDRHGTPYLAWNDRRAGVNQIQVRRWDGSAWQPVGQGLLPGPTLGYADLAASPELAFAPDGSLYVAWSGYRLNGRSKPDVFVYRWDGTRWREIGGDPKGGSIWKSNYGGYRPDIAVAPDGLPWVVWMERNAQGYHRIYARRWDGAAWVDVGAGSTTGGGLGADYGRSDWPTIAFRSDGAAFVAWTMWDSGNLFVFAKQWDGGAWVEPVPASAGGTRVAGPFTQKTLSVSLSISPHGHTYIAWHAYARPTGREEIFVRRLTGEGWVDVGAGSGSGAGVSDNRSASLYPSLAAADDGVVYVAWQDDLFRQKEIMVRQSAPGQRFIAFVPVAQAQR